MELNITITDEQLFDLLNNLNEDQKEKIFKSFSFDIISELGKMLKETDYDWYSYGSGWRSGSEIREAIVRIQGIEQEYRRDKESEINYLKFNMEHYKKYYNRMFELYHEGYIPLDKLPNHEPSTGNS